MTVVVEEGVRRSIDQLGEEVDGVAHLPKREVGEGQNAEVHLVQLRDEVGAVPPRRVQVGEDVLLGVAVLADDEGDFEGGRASGGGYARRHGHPHPVREEPLSARHVATCRIEC